MTFRPVTMFRPLNKNPLKNYRKIKALGHCYQIFKLTILDN